MTELEQAIDKIEDLYRQLHKAEAERDKLRKFAKAVLLVDGFCYLREPKDAERIGAAIRHSLLQADGYGYIPTPLLTGKATK